jgi:hypothetical protein
MLGQESEASSNEEAERNGPVKADDAESFADKKIAELEKGIKSPDEEGDK